MSLLLQSFELGILLTEGLYNVMVAACAFSLAEFEQSPQHAGQQSCLASIAEQLQQLRESS